MSQLNSLNFIRWYSGSTIQESSVNLPRLGVVDAKTYLPVFVPGEQSGFFINSDIPFYDADNFTTLRLDILNTSGTLVTSIGAAGATIVKVPLSLGYRIFATFSMPAIANGQYQFSIYNTATSTTKCVSNYFQVINSADAQLQTVSISWRNSRDSFFYNWSLVPDFNCQIRLHISMASYQPEETIDQTKAVSTGTRRNNNYETELSYKLSTYYFDDGANLACIPLFKADYLSINNKIYIQKSAYLPNARTQSNVSIGEIEIYDQAFSRINKYGQLPQLVLKTGRYVLVNTTAVSFGIQLYSSAAALLSTVTVAPGATKVINIGDLQLNGYLNLLPASSGTYHLLVSNSLPDGTFTTTISTQAGAAAFGQTNQNAIYGNDYFAVLS
jgi:hypothetical protein